MAERHDPAEVGRIVEITPKSVEIKTMDRTVADLAHRNGGRYSVALHLRQDPSATAEFAETHVRRLEAIRRVSGRVERLPDGTWMIGVDYIARTEAFERRLAQNTPVVVASVSRVPLDKLPNYDGVTWLDHELVGNSQSPIRDQGFGRETRNALTQRRAWLLQEQLAEDVSGQLVPRPNLLAALRRREIARVSGQLSAELGLEYLPAAREGAIEGRYRKPVNLAARRMAVIQLNTREFTLVLWRPVLDRALGREVTGVIHGESISWTIGRQRGRSVN